ncbi:hypothetical protein L210DRAFT_943898 [Boletus edulis BED1]|uniref:Uncharacterized protein n=1 Tax=Boletus edulis BED1 TaxID=1328754 RepID=A0AAD4BVH2_BOLED|nr:hypothetical protein L210DRAFT_943898 [Boletus edulis BED1]
MRFYCSHTADWGKALGSHLYFQPSSDLRHLPLGLSLTAFFFKQALLSNVDYYYCHSLTPSHTVPYASSTLVHIFASSPHMQLMRFVHTIAPVYPHLSKFVPYLSNFISSFHRSSFVLHCTTYLLSCDPFVDRLGPLMNMERQLQFTVQFKHTTPSIHVPYVVSFVQQCK